MDVLFVRLHGQFSARAKDLFKVNRIFGAKFVPEEKKFNNHAIPMGYVAWWLQRLGEVTIFVILAKFLPIFVSVFRRLVEVLLETRERWEGVGET